MPEYKNCERGTSLSFREKKKKKRNITGYKNTKECDAKSDCKSQVFQSLVFFFFLSLLLFQNPTSETGRWPYIYITNVCHFKSQQASSMAQSPSPGKGSLTAVASVLAAEFQNGCSAKHAGPSPPLSSSSSSSPPDKHLVTKKLMRLLALPLLQHMGISDDSNNNNNDGAAPASAPLDFVDSACGTGVLTQELQRMLPRDVLDESTFLCADTSRVFVDMVAERARDEGWVNVRPEVLDAMVRGGFVQLQGPLLSLSAMRLLGSGYRLV